jgi:beta-glucanase (GH16 family)
MLLCTLLLACAGCVPTAVEIPPTESALPPSPTPEKWHLVWSDEFDAPDGSIPDPAKWNYTIGGSGFGNGELQYYTDDPQQACIENGMLVIKADRKTVMGRDYISARLNTMVKGTWKYGRFEIRAKLPDTQGIWPAFWLLPMYINYGNWPASGEVDIMELIGKEPGRVYGTLHYGNPHKSQSAYYDLHDGRKFSDDFHVFSLEWEPEQFRWYVDGTLYLTADQWFTSAPGKAFPAPFDQPFYLIINLAVGGHWPGSPDSFSTFPQFLYVDYVRIYQEQP